MESSESVTPSVAQRIAEIQTWQTGRPSREYYLEHFGPASYIFHDYEDVPWLLAQLVEARAEKDAPSKAMMILQIEDMHALSAGEMIDRGARVHADANSRHLIAGGFQLEAAEAEIARLRDAVGMYEAALEAIAEECEGQPAGTLAQQTLANVQSIATELRAEVERLRASLEAAKRTRDSHKNKATKARQHERVAVDGIHMFKAENERLRAGMERVIQWANNSTVSVGEFTAVGKIVGDLRALSTVSSDEGGAHD